VSNESELVIPVFPVMNEIVLTRAVFPVMNELLLTRPVLAMLCLSVYIILLLP